MRETIRGVIERGRVPVPVSPTIGTIVLVSVVVVVCVSRVLVSGTLVVVVAVTMLVVVGVVMVMVGAVSVMGVALIVPVGGGGGVSGLVDDAAIGRVNVVVFVADDMRQGAEHQSVEPEDRQPDRMAPQVRYPTDM